MIFSLKRSPKKRMPRFFFWGGGSMGATITEMNALTKGEFLSRTLPWEQAFNPPPPTFSRLSLTQWSAGIYLFIFLQQGSECFVF